MAMLFEYKDYRQYLQDRFAADKKQHSYFSYRYFARMAGLSSPGYLKMVMDGDRNLSPNSIHKFNTAFKHNKKEGAYFEALVLFNQAKNGEERELYLDRLRGLKPPAQVQGLEKDQFEYFTRKHFVVIREMVALPHFREDYEWIGKNLQPPIKAREVEHALEVLLRIGLVRRNENGKLVQSHASLSTPPEVASLDVFNFQKEMLDEAKNAFFTVKPALRDITSLTISIPQLALPLLKQRIESFRKEIIQMIETGNQDYFEVYQMNIQLFPVTKTSGSE